jgi:heat shock protein HtpX
VLLVVAFVLVVVAVVSAVGQLFGYGIPGVLLALVIAGVGAFVAYWKSDAVALRMSHAQPADPVEYARLHNVVEGLCIAGGLPKPRVYIVDDAAPNAFATGRDPKHAAIAVTTGLLEKMNRIELEGVLAHELSHVKNYDVLVSTLAVTLVGVAVPWLVPVAVGRGRESSADISGVALTRYPPGLISALEKLKADNTVVHSNPRATAHLWIESPVTREVDERIKVLKEL